MSPSSPTKYRSALRIIQSILELLVRSGNEGMIKSQIYKEVGLKTSVGEKYLEQLGSAQYIVISQEQWGKERIRNIVRVTPTGTQRFQWFIQLSNELRM
ncbi:MAG: hypothetical protein ACTSVU_00470 [Promethearchaeota archaeon]